MGCTSRRFHSAESRNAACSSAAASRASPCACGCSIRSSSWSVSRRNSANSSAYAGPEISCAGERSRRFAISSIESERRHLSPFRYPCRVERGIPSSFENSSFVFPVSFILLCSMAAIFFSICISKATSHQKDTEMVSLVNTGMLAKRPAFRHGGKPSKSAAISAPRKLLRGGRIALILQVFPMVL